MNILITGAGGMLGHEFVELSKQIKYHSLNIESSKKISINHIFKDLELDVTNYDSLRDYFLSFSSKGKNIDVVINCAAYTAVDDAEDNEDKAYLINEKGAENLAVLSNEFNYLLVQISTDFIFDGDKDDLKPYLESNSTNPLSVYGASKLKGELAIIARAKEYLIFRTSWLYSIYGKNFFKTILKLSEDRGSISVISDQIGTPTYALDLAEAILDVIKLVSIDKEIGKKSSYLNSIYNFSNDGNVSWFQFAKEIVKLSGNNCIVNPIPTSGYKTKAVRPKYSVLDKSKIQNDFGIEIKQWEKRLQSCYERSLLF